MTGRAGHQFYGRVPEDTLPTLARASLILLEKTWAQQPDHPWRMQAIEDFGDLAGDIAPAREVDGRKLDLVRRSLRTAGALSESRAAALVATRVKDDTYKRTGNLLTGWVLAAALRRRLVAPDENAIPAGLDAARLLKSKAAAELSRLEPFPDSPELLLDRLRAAEKAVKGQRKIARYFERIAALIRAAHEERNPIYRSRDGSDGDVPTGFAEPAPDLAVLNGGFQPQPARFAGPVQEQIVDRVSEVVAVQGEDSEESFVPHAVAVKRTAKAARSAARRDLALSAEMDPLTRHEIAVLRTWLRENAGHPAHSLILSDLSYGAALENTTETDWNWDFEADHFAFCLFVTLPDFESLVETSDDDGERLVLTAPAVLNFPPIDCGKDVTGAVADVFKTLRPKLARPLARGRCLRFKSDWLRRAGADQAVIAFLTGTDPGNRAQMHYTALDRQVLAGWHRRYVEEGLGLELPDTPASTPGLYGSLQRPPAGLIACVFREARDDLRARRPAGAGSFAELVDFHNAYALYTLMLLYFATGHRPVSHPFEFRADFDLEARLLWVSDKTGRGARGTRLLALPPRAAEQAGFWVRHLEGLRRRLSLTHPDLADGPVRQALALSEAERGPFFFLIGKTGKAEPMRPRLQEDAVQTVLPAALNWTRHVLRSGLAGRCDPAVLDAFLGHGHLGEEAFSQGSSLGLSDLFLLADQIDTLLAEHDVKAVESPL